MYERRAAPIRVDLLQLDRQGIGIMLRGREDLRAVEGKDVVRDALGGLGGEVGVVDAEVVVEPGDLVGDELWRDEPALADEPLDFAPLGVLALEDGRGVSGDVLEALDDLRMLSRDLEMARRVGIGVQ